MARRISLLDALCRQYPSESRDYLYRCIMCGEVRRGDQKITNPREPVGRDDSFLITRARFVSRGGEKLEAALSAWGIVPSGRRWVDAGASTGGFTDCLLQQGASLVHAVDVGYNQLDYRLRSDPRVQVYERTNIRDLQVLSPRPHAAVCDLSFRSLRGVLGHLLDLTLEGWAVALLKPQFEAAAEVRWGRRDPADTRSGVLCGALRDQVVSQVIVSLEREEGVCVLRRLASPLPGRQGNREELLLVGRVERDYPRKSPGLRGLPI
ncbi:23S rRNA (cytidine1920-2'-O)/16S rRNA (cytidine1409-2'-O)-methyltransferase [Alkalispirochaeta americana]|uniref:23S rRNA (Cytidine1920-2'-O)/16S rRNA (Cytidine1409-2'-O)-methyltransferase n=1 Tax=Alkalispirochaeta americana TaxID=159291 RepID=A0A1N6W0J5_9SPIO|nr:TlyA family RNA methyltransferase [Alkalispirochaeta americana]SIQ83570.1 23S rRNA (cytidine1920-2'-O)/16S rRNA (cytidine1409-2'-O)-methyltransferase [Alkalispirochaeta americana]